MSELLSSIVGGGGLPKLAPDLTYPSDKDANATYKRISAIDASAGLTTVLSLTGKWAVSYMALLSITAEVNTIKLTIDGVVKWDTTYTPGTTDNLLGAINNSQFSPQDIINGCDSTFLLEYQTATDTNITFDYLARPIL